MRCVEREGVALEHHDLFKKISEHARCRQTSHSRANDDGLPADRFELHQSLPSIILRHLMSARPTRGVSQITPQAALLLDLAGKR